MLEDRSAENRIPLLETCTWAERPKNIEPRPGVVQLWRASLVESVRGCQSFWKFLSDEEKSRAKNIPNEKRGSFISCRAILRLILSSYLETEPSRIRVLYGKHNKPALAQEYKLKFNFAHSGNLALYAIALSQVGVDLERIHKMNGVDLFASRFFSHEEQLLFHNSAGEKKQLEFFQIWTRKEAYVKAKGASLAEFLSEAGDSSSEVTKWYFRSLKPETGYVAAVATPDRINELCCWNWVQ